MFYALQLNIGCCDPDTLCNPTEYRSMCPDFMLYVLYISPNLFIEKGMFYGTDLIIRQLVVEFYYIAPKRAHNLFLSQVIFCDINFRSQFTTAKKSDNHNNQYDILISTISGKDYISILVKFSDT